MGIGGVRMERLTELLGVIICIKFTCEKLKEQGKKKIDIDWVLNAINKILED